MCAKKNSLVYLVSVFFLFAICACSQASEPKSKKDLNPLEQFGENKYYFLGLKEKKNGNKSEAKKNFMRCVKKGNGLAVRKSLEELCESEDVQEKISNAKKLIELYDDEDALLFAVKIFSENNEPNLLIKNTNKIDLKNSNNELIRLRLEAQKKRGDSSFKDDLYTWFFSRAMTEEHYKFLCDNLKFDIAQVLQKSEDEKNNAEDWTDWEKKLFLINYRSEVYKKNYPVAELHFPIVQKIVDGGNGNTNQNVQTGADGQTGGALVMTEQLMSDIGKMYLYGNSASVTAARFFQSEAKKHKGTPIEFYCHFYAGRLYDKAGGYYTQMEKSFVAAVESVDAQIQTGSLAASGENVTQNTLNSAEFGQNVTQNDHFLQLRDNALWYLFKTSIKTSISSSIAYIERFVTQIADSYYFDDFFDLLSPLLLAEGKYKEIGDLYKLMKGYASDESTAKYAYIYARLLEEGIYNPQRAELVHQSAQVAGAEELSTEELKKNEIRAAYEAALNSATDMYYKVMAAERLGYYDFEKEKLFCEPRKLNKQTSQADNFQTDIAADLRTDSDVEQLLNGYAFFGFPEKIYSEWVKLGSPVLSIDTTINLCKLLRDSSTGGSDDNNLVQSLRIAAKTANYSKTPLTLELLEYVYPKNYEELVTKYCEKYGIQKSVLWALIRSESFFDPDVVSSAGAVGLCQLMSFTGEDIAHRLRKSDYDLTDPETSIEFGAYYLDNLIGRLDGSYLDAFFSYNAGISRVRKWKKSSALGFGVKEIPEDLFLETLPYAETREYGRKLVAATEMYDWLWYRH